MDSSTNSMYSVAPTVFKDGKHDPVKLYLDGIAEDKASLEAAKAKRQMEGAKRMDAANKAATSLKVTGWKNHDEVRNKLAGDLQGKLTNLFVEYDGSPFEGKDGQLRYSEFNKDINNYNKFEEYSKQIQAETEASIAEAAANPNLYTQESLDNLNNYVNSGYDYQMKEGIPILEEVEAEFDAMAHLMKTTVGQDIYSSTKPTEDGTKHSSGTSTSEKKVGVIDNPKIEKWYRSYKKGDVTKPYESLFSLFENKWEIKAMEEAYDNTDETIDETGFNEYEREELKFVQEESAKVRVAATTKRRTSTITENKSQGDEEEVTPGRPITQGAYIDGTGEFGNRTGNTVGIVNVSGKGVNKTAQINPASYMEHSDGSSEFKSNTQNQMEITPGKMYMDIPIYMGSNDITIGNRTIKTGEMISPALFENLEATNPSLLQGFVKEPVVEGTIKVQTPGRYGQSAITTTKTIRVRAKDVSESGFDLGVDEFGSDFD